MIQINITTKSTWNGLYCVLVLLQDIYSHMGQHIQHNCTCQKTETKK